MEYLYNALAIAALVFGFGFVVFFHELGHFVAAKWVGIRVEQFAIGFGHAVACWRKGMGFMWGSSAKRVEELLKAHILAKRERELQPREHVGFTPEEMTAAAAALGVGETEYRINWIPLGGYVKMLGQDDLNPAATSDDPRSYNRKSVGARMTVVSAGVIMNVILAALLFMGVFIIGHKVSPAMVGAVWTNSPAQLGGMDVGDRVLQFDGRDEHSFTGLMLDIALVREAKSVPVKVQRPVYANGKFGGYETKELEVHPVRPSDDSAAFYAIGIQAIADLRGADIKLKDLGDLKLDRATDIFPGDRITAVNGTMVKPEDYPVFAEALQRSSGKPVELTVIDRQGKKHLVKAAVQFQRFFGDTPFNMAGLEPQPVVAGFPLESPVKDKLQRGDVICAMFINGEKKEYPSVEEVSNLTSDAADRKLKVDFQVERDGKRETIPGTVPNLKIDKGKRGVGIQIELSTGRPVVADVIAGSAAAHAGIPRGALITSVNDVEVKNWFDVHRLLKSAANSSATITYVELDDAGHPKSQTAKTVKLEMSKEERETLARIRYTHDPMLLLPERIESRRTHNPLLAAKWGVIETRDMLRQFYVTLRRLFQGRVSASNFMGPVGILHAGSIFAFRGWDWLIWFLAMISANLAVVNFLPIPIVDGGLFLFLIIEKVSGRPLSPRMQTVAQIVGLAIILSVFLLVTYQDIRRLIL